MLSASNIPVPDHTDEHPKGQQPTDVLLLPSFTVIENITPADVQELIDTVISNAPTNTTRVTSTKSSLPPALAADAVVADPALPPAATESTVSIAPSIPFSHHPSPHIALILLCSQKTRDARCGQSAPLLRREFERHLRPLGLYRDLHDQRPGGIGIYFISHVGGHKYSANVMVYRRAGHHFQKWAPTDSSADGRAANGEKENGAEVDQGAAQCIWLARVKPEDCEGVIKFTVLQGKVRKPGSQLRGGFDRERGMVSW